MYAPPFCRADEETLLGVVDQFPFATVFSGTPAEPGITHTPVLVHRRPDGSLFAEIHFARANVQSRNLDGEFVTISVLGPHCHISPAWYQRPNVPTWDYVAVRITGKAKAVLGETEKLAMVTRLVDRFEAATEFTLDRLETEDLYQQLGSIRCFEVDVDSIDGSLKLSQNRRARSLENVKSALRERGLWGDGEIADLIDRYVVKE